MIDIINSQKCYTSPTTYWTIQYEYKREGADMYYRFYWKVWLHYADGRYDYAVALKFYLDGAEHSVTVKGLTDMVYGWSKSGTTDWYKVTGKTTGSTAFYAKLYDTTRSKTMVTSSTYSLTVSGAASVMGAIPSFNVDNGVTIPITKYDTSFVDTLVISYGGTTIKTVSGITNGTKVTFANELTTIYGLMSTVKSGTFGFALTTTSGTTTIGTSTATATGEITNANPSFTASQVSYADTNTAVTAVTENPLHIVQNKSTVSVTIDTAAVGNKGANITQYALTLNGVTKTMTAKGTVSFGTINSSSNATLSVVVTDSRGNTTAVSKTVTILAWSLPVVNATLERLNNYEDETYLTAKASISSVNSKNTVTITYKYKKSGGSYGTPTTISNNTKYTIDCDKNYAYVFSITATDKFGSTTKEFNLGKGIFPLFIDTRKNSVGINCFPVGEQTLEVGGYEFVGNTMCGRSYADTDANNVVTQGRWIVPESGECKNYPSAGGNGLLLVFGNITVVFQVFVRYDGTAWSRMLWYNTWSSWKQLTT